MTCEACAIARENPRSAEYRNGCEGCTVRAVASGPDFFVADREGRFTPGYVELMTRVFGSLWRDAHELVKSEAARRLSLTRAGNPGSIGRGCDA